MILNRQFQELKSSKLKHLHPEQNIFYLYRICRLDLDQRTYNHTLSEKQKTGLLTENNI